LSWTHYRRLIAVESKEARDFYETEAVRGGWSVRQLDRQISTQFYERTALSRDKASMQWVATSHPTCPGPKLQRSRTGL
jgi:predicted nuclease of restriction endonuclease-like (RecB) superfamily